MKKLSIIIFLLTTINIWGQTTTNTPKEVVQFALTALTNGDIEKLITVTESTELKQAQDLLVSIEGDTQKKEELIIQYKSLKSWKIESTDEHLINNRKLAIVTTKWEVLPTLENHTINKNLVSNKTRTIYVDYMLEKFNGQWKIISRRTVN